VWVLFGCGASSLLRQRPERDVLFGGCAPLIGGRSITETVDSTPYALRVKGMVLPCWGIRSHPLCTVPLNHTPIVHGTPKSHCVTTSTKLNLLLYLDISSAAVPYTRHVLSNILSRCSEQHLTRGSVVHIPPNHLRNSQDHISYEHLRCVPPDSPTPQC